MSDAFAQELDRLLHSARDELDRLDYARRHCEAVTAGVHALAAAIDHLDDARHGLLVRIAEVIGPGQRLPSEHDRVAALAASFAGGEGRE